MISMEDDAVVVGVRKVALRELSPVDGTERGFPELVSIGVRTEDVKIGRSVH